MGGVCVFQRDQRPAVVQYNGTRERHGHIKVVKLADSLVLASPQSSNIKHHTAIKMASPSVQIKATLQKYREALVASNAPACTALYTDDGVVMAQGFQSQVGHTAVSEWYKLCFSLIQLDVKFTVQEVVVVSEKYAFARTTSAGTQKVHAIGKVSEEKNQELFVMEKVGEQWKIARYCFSTTLPPR